MLRNVGGANEGSDRRIQFGRTDANASKWEALIGELPNREGLRRKLFTRHVAEDGHENRQEDQKEEEPQAPISNRK